MLHLIGANISLYRRNLRTSCFLRTFLKQIGFLNYMLLKTKFETNPELGCDPSKRSIQDLLELGVIVLNKPRGPTSHEVSEHVKNILHVSKAGQSGTLDPAVTGVLPIGLGKATRALRVILLAPKEYVCLMHIHDDCSEDDIRKVCSQFVGKIQQLPPIKSAVKRQVRTREIYYISILEISGRDVLFKVGCQAGTYIRKLCDDIGKKLGSGAHMAQLVRTKAGPCTDLEMHTLQEVEDAYHSYKQNKDELGLRKIVQPVEHIFSHLPKIWVMDTTIDSLCHGASLGVPGISGVDDGITGGDIVAVMSLKQEVVGLGIAKMTSSEMIHAQTGVAAILDTVLMKTGVYPKWNQS